MAKRFTDTAKWDDAWFDSLGLEDKLFWLYLCDKCDHAGMWKVNVRQVQFHIAPTYTPDASKFLGRVRVLSNDKWFVEKFVDFQYGKLNPDNRVHASVLLALEKEGAYKGPRNKGLTSPLDRAMDKDKDKEKDTNDFGFDAFWNLYPKKQGKGDALKAWKKIGPSVALYAQIMRAVAEQKASVQWGKDGGQYIPNPATWLNGGRWDDVSEPINQGPKGTRCGKRGCGLTGNWVKGVSHDGKTGLCAACLDEEAVLAEREVA